MFMAPMLLEKREQPFEDERFIFEPKIDGHRLILSYSDGSVRLYTRHNNEVTRQYPELHDVPIDADEAVLDGEVAYVNPQTGAVEFETVMERFMMTKPQRINDGRTRLPVHFFAFDILRYNGEDVRNQPLTERKALLDAILTNTAHFSRVLSVDGSGIALFNTIKERKLEGIVAKRKDSVYVGRRSDNWLKVINYEYADVHIAGYRKDNFGWLAHYNGRPAGIIELAVPAAHRKAFYGVAQSIVTGEDHEYVYVQPRIKARVRFRNWTKKGYLRTPEFVSFVK
ncbi:DNA ligase-1 [Paenibacillus sp. BK033]|nr:RNA ligase family protein [Paenibacillus sp. BK033]TCM89619.1 DNA ligase-1 [Paenibacillus sp. BK033]